MDLRYSKLTTKNETEAVTEFVSSGFTKFQYGANALYLSSSVSCIGLSFNEILTVRVVLAVMSPVSTFSLVSNTSTDLLRNVKAFLPIPRPEIISPVAIFRSILIIALVISPVSLACAMSAP